MKIRYLFKLFEKGFSFLQSLGNVNVCHNSAASAILDVED